MKSILFGFVVFLVMGCAQPLTDEQVKAVAQTCERAGMTVYVQLGMDNYVKCVKKE